MARPRKYDIPVRALPWSTLWDKCPECGRVKKLRARDLDLLVKLTLEVIESHRCKKGLYLQSA